LEAGFVLRSKAHCYEHTIAFDASPQLFDEGILTSPRL
jgi:hypothetical protein